MIGAIIGDIAGSCYEFNPTRDYNFTMFAPGSNFTDDTICTVAVADALLRGEDYGSALHRWCRRYLKPKGGFGGRFRRWVESDRPEPYGSLGNGSAMRVSPTAWVWTDREATLYEAALSAACTHNHPEGMLGARVTALAIFLARQQPKPSADEIVEECVRYSGYNVNLRMADVAGRFDETCPGTVPVALWILKQSHGFEDALRRAISLGADADTLGAIVGSIAGALWGVPEWMRERAMGHLPQEMKDVINQFESRYGRE